MPTPSTPNTHSFIDFGMFFPCGLPPQQQKQQQKPLIFDSFQEKTNLSVNFQGNSFIKTSMTCLFVTRPHLSGHMQRWRRVLGCRALLQHGPGQGGTGDLRGRELGDFHITFEMIFVFCEI